MFVAGLPSVTYGDGDTQSYTFDATGNRATKSDTVSGSGTTGETYSCDAANRLTSKTVGSTTHTVTSDANGNTLNDNNGSNRFNIWDSQNRLTSCTVFDSHGASTTSAFTYGSDGLRRRGVVTSYSTGVHSGAPSYPPAQGSPTGSTQTDYIYDGTMMVEEIIRHFDGSGTALDTPVTISYLQGPSGPLYRKSSAATDPTWYVYDGLGSVVGEVDVNGNLSATKQFDVYGATRAIGGSPTTRQGFVGGLGHETDDETGLVYMRARYYDPSTGRFISEDSMLQGENWYGYASNNPINIVDPSGNAILPLTSVVDWAAGEIWACYAAAIAFSNRGANKAVSWTARSMMTLAISAFACSLMGLAPGADISRRLLTGASYIALINIIVSGIEAMGKSSYPGLPAAACAVAIYGTAVAGALMSCEYAMDTGT